MIPRKFAWIKEHAAAWPIALMCRVLKVSRSGYYAWRDRPRSERAKRRAALAQRIREAHEASRCTYGSPRVHRELAAQGERLSVNTVARLMRENDLYSSIRRRYKVRTTDSAHAYGVSPDRVQRDFAPRSGGAERNRIWATDITYVPTLEGWLYLAVVLDLRSRRVIGYATADHLRASLALDALAVAIDTRKPPGGSLDGLVHHSDRGVQYACTSYRAMLEAHGVASSMSRTGNCYDNAVAESFFGTLKQELIHRDHYATRAQADTAIADYIDNFYNPIRRHSTLGYVSPVDYERMTA